MQGTKVECVLCGKVQDVPPQHIGPIDEFGMRTDYQQNSQYFYGVYEYMLADDFFAEQAKPSLPAIVFALDVSSTAIITGFFQQVVNTIKSSIDYLTNGPQTDICIMTFD